MCLVCLFFQGNNGGGGLYYLQAFYGTIVSNTAVALFRVDMVNNTSGSFSYATHCISVSVILVFSGLIGILFDSPLHSNAAMVSMVHGDTSGIVPMWCWTLCYAGTAGVSRGGGAYFDFNSNDNTVDTNVTLVDCRFNYNKAGKKDCQCLDCLVLMRFGIEPVHGYF